MKLKTWWRAHKPSKRRLIQLYAALLFNANLKGFATGRIYEGGLKNICTPGLNCYSCPGASGACPMGALQNSLASSGKTVPYYMFGIIMLYGLLFGRWICGFLCPFGLIQDLLYKIKTPKVKKGKITRVLSYFKYVVLVFFVVVFPLAYVGLEFPLPGFCKYICPSGTLLGAVGLLSNPENNNMLRMLGPLFTWKFLLLVVFLVGSVFIYRFFCRFFCPLGALYGLFNKISFVGVKLDKESCTNCGLCTGKCKMDVRHVGDHECINCGECLDVCPTGAIQWKGPKILLPPQAIGGLIATKGAGTAAKAAETVTEAADASSGTDVQSGQTTNDEAVRLRKAMRRNRVARIVAGVLAMALLVGALYYYNFVDGREETPEPTPPPATVETGSGEVDTGEPLPPVGNRVGDLCPDRTLNLYNGDTDTFAVSDNRSKVTVINFWGVWCGPCIAELPHFSDVAETYGDRVTVVAIHSDFDQKKAPEWIQKNYPDTSILFAQDVKGDAYYKALGGPGTYPMTLILDERGVITFTCVGSITHDDLVAEVEKALH